MRPPHRVCSVGQHVKKRLGGSVVLTGLFYKVDVEFTVIQMGANRPFTDENIQVLVTAVSDY